MKCASAFVRLILPCDEMGCDGSNFLLGKILFPESCPKQIRSFKSAPSHVATTRGVCVSQNGMADECSS
jgi:hypothetical protein